MDNKHQLSVLLKKLWSHFSVRRQRQAMIVLFLMFISALTDVISLGAVLPFIGVLVAPEQVFNHPFVMPIAEFFQINSAKQLTLPLTIAFAFTAIIAGIMRLFLLWLNVRLTSAIGTDLSFNIYNRTLYQPYHIHLSRNTSSIVSAITGKVNNVVGAILLPLFRLLSSILLLVGISVTLFIIDPFIATIATIGFGSVYGLISFLVRFRLNRNSRRVAEEETRVVKALQEGLGGIRDVLLDGTQEIYSNIYRKADVPLRLAKANNLFISGSPRFLMETLGITFLVLFAYLLNLKPGGISASLPLLAVLALGAQRLLPALQQCYASWSTMIGNYASLEDLLELINQPLPEKIENTAITPLAFTHAIEFKNVSYQYSDDGPWILSHVNFTIPKGSSVGIVGRTGSGKSTILDLLMGLIEPTEGKILIDGVEINKQNMRSWQSIISHVPQSIFLTDASIAENIALGVPQDKIDLERVKKSTSIAQISEFIEAAEEGYSLVVGERGVRLSGGQRQRIGIARSIYKSAKVLVFDEATSALDNDTEVLVVDAINKMEENFTIFFVAHRLTTISECDTIIELDAGKVIAQGKFKDFLRKSNMFRHMQVPK